MARLDPLIRFHRHAIDDKRRALAALYNQAEALQQKKKEVLEALAREAGLAENSNSVDVQMWFGRYAISVKDQMAEIDRAAAQLDLKISRAQEDVREAFAELKKIEITDRERKKAEKKKRDTAEAAELDEVGIEGHRRKTES